MKIIIKTASDIMVTDARKTELIESIGKILEKANIEYIKFKETVWYPL